jgi:predicted AAA+ superfamily ATPase
LLLANLPRKAVVLDDIHKMRGWKAWLKAVVDHGCLSRACS